MNEITTQFVSQIPDFSGEGVMEVTLRRPSLLTLAAQGTVPNELLGCARTLFSEGGASLPLDELGRLLRLIAKAALVSPSFDELENSGAELTDEQLTAIYSFVQNGVRALFPFRQERKYDNAADDERKMG